MKAHRILLVTDIFPPEIGGPATFIEKLARRLSAEGCQVTVVCAVRRGVGVSDTDRPYRVIRVLRRAGWFPVCTRLILAWQMLRHRRVLVNGLEEHAEFAARWTGRRYLAKVVGDIAWEASRNAGETTLDVDAFQRDAAAQTRWGALVKKRRAALDRARLVFTPSDYLRDLVQGWGVPAEKVVRIYNGVVLAQAAAVIPFRTHGPLRVVFAGRLTNWKGVETLLLALARLDGVTAEVVGDGPELPALEALGRQLQLEGRVRFFGRRQQQQVAEHMRQAHVLVLTSLYEGLSHTLIEAGAEGLPCIASRRGGNPEVIQDGRNGILVPAQDVSALAAALARLRDDEALRRRLGLTAREMATAFDLSRTVEHVADLLEKELK